MKYLWKVAVDLDDVTVDFFAGVIASMNREFGVSIDKETVTTWDDNVVKLFDWKTYGYRSWWDWMKDRDWLWSTFDAIPGAIGGIAALRARGYYVEALTSKPMWAEAQVWKWLGKWRPAFNQVTITSLEHPKHELSDADILVDDKPGNIDGWVKDGRFGVLFRQPWNDAYDIPSSSIRVMGWGGVLGAIDIIAALEGIGEEVKS